MKTRSQKIEVWRKRREASVAYLVLVGVNGMISIFLNLDFEKIQSTGWDSLKMGEKIGLLLYFGALSVGLIFRYISGYKCKHLEQEPIEKILDRSSGKGLES